ncbi:MAG TPA: bifunctional [glutamine synthetase] adenylyltransferase/[glutamine synthetase]-adenylyl-L-tyrosine phosphorylase [Acidimicrobiales bacterium]|nr:bifunctional [glutamine synthetase] adenylyltransferase/[glutamine synthetase]-adenylyl-L-tyrosine phosphorylase [Acidimicrobiales bacterium]
MQVAHDRVDLAQGDAQRRHTRSVPAAARLLAVLPKVVADAVERSAAPASVEVALARLGEERPHDLDRVAEDSRMLDAVVAVVAASRFLARLLLSDARAVDVLADLDRRPHLDGEDVPRWKRLELLRIAARDLTGRDALEAVGAALAAMADDVLRTAVEDPGLAVIGMGKLGGRELNYASDIDVLFVGEGDARRVMERARSCFRVDADLRPEGRDGPLVRTPASYEQYWDNWASTWEFQALLKARFAAGDDALGTAFLAAARRRVWERPFGAEELREVRAMKARAEGEVAKRGMAERELKRGRGGIRDIEFAVQLLQLVHGRHDDALRSPTTLDALAELTAAGYVDADDGRTLAGAYRFLRTVEHRLQLVDEQQVHAVPADTAARMHLARVLGYLDVGELDAELRRLQAAVRSIHERLFFRPLLEAFSGASAMSTEAAEARLAAFGFADADRTRQALAELTRGLTRSSRLMQQMLPLLLGWLSEAPDPDLGLLGLRTLASGPHRAAQLVTTFRDFPEAARRLCLLLGTSRLLVSGLSRHPDLIAALGDDTALAVDDVAERTSRALAWRAGGEHRRQGLLRLKRAEELRCMASDVLGLVDATGTGRALTALAESVVDAALRIVDPQVPMVVVAMGRFGGAELSYASDLDVLLVYDGTTPEHFAAANAAAEAFLRLLGGETPAAGIYVMDADLRPEGKQGPLARSLDGYRAYYERWAQTWERQSLVRARPVAGDAAVADAFAAVVEGFVWGRPFTDDEIRDVRRMKARIERERIPAGDDPQFHLKLGRGSLSDVEWTAQLLQLQHGVRSQGTVAALRALREAGALDAADEQALADAYRFCERTRNRWYLVKGSHGDALPARKEQLDRLAHSLGGSAGELREEYRRVTRRARAVVERLLYGRAE